MIIVVFVATKFCYIPQGAVSRLVAGGECCERERETVADHLSGRTVRNDRASSGFRLCFCFSMICWRFSLISSQIMSRLIIKLNVSGENIYIKLL